MVATSSG